MAVEILKHFKIDKYFSADVMGVFSKYRLTPSVSYTTEEDHAAITMVESGLGISMLNRLATAGIQTKAVILPLAPEEAVELGIAIPSRMQAPPAVRRFVDKSKIVFVSTRHFFS